MSYLEKKIKESHHIMANTTSDKKYHSAARQLEFLTKHKKQN